MVILHVNKFFYPRGGAERYMFLLCDELERRGHRLVHFSMSHPDNLDSPTAEYFVSYRDYRTGRGVRERFRDAASFIRSREASGKIARLVAAVRPDVAHLHNIYHQLTPSVIVALKRLGVPVVMTLHDYKLVCPNYSLFAHGRFCDRCLGGRFYRAALTRCHDGSLLRGVLLSVEAYWQRNTGVYGEVDRMIAPSRFMRETVVGEGFDAGRVLYLPNPLPPTGVDAAASAPAPAESAPLPERYILYFGRLSPEKGLDVLLSALRPRPDVSLVVCGEGSEGARLRAYAKEHLGGRVVFTGYLGRARLDAVIAAAAAVVVPSVWPENAPYGVLEAVAAGVPVIVSDMGGLPELVEVFGGRVFGSGEAAELGARIDEVWGGGGRARAASGELPPGFRAEEHVDVIESLYVELAGGAAGEGSR